MASNNNAVLCMAAGPSQVLVIKKAKELGFKVIAVDRNPDAIGFNLADEKLVLSTYEPLPIINHVRKLTKYYVTGIINRSSGMPVVATAVISKAFGLPGVEPLVSEAIVFKSRLNKICKEKNIPVPQCQSIQNLSGVEMDRIKFPCVIKPSLSLIGKKGVNVIRNKNEFPLAFQRAKELSVDGWVNIEEYVMGHDIVLIAVVYRGELIPVVLLDELNSIGIGVELCGRGFAVPSIFSGAPEEGLILNLARDIVNKLKLQRTVFLMACRCEKNGSPRLIEIHLDLGGDLILDELLPSSSDFDFVKFAINILTGQPIDKPEPLFSPVAILYGKGEEFVYERPFQLVKADSRDSLEEKLRAIFNQSECFDSISGEYS